MIRTDILEHRSQLQALCTKIQSTHPAEFEEPVGLKLVDAALGECRGGKLSLTLKNFDRVIRHYLELLESRPDAIVEFNTACQQVAIGRQHDQAIRYARNQHKKAANNTSNATLCKHDRVLEEILSI
jgi:hypothetical protein